MKLMLILAAAFLSLNVSGKTVNTMPMQTYMGKEYRNQKATGNTCVVVVNDYYSNEVKGNACSKMDVSYYFHGEEVKGDANFATVQSRLTNYHRPEYPEMKTCAEPISDPEGIKIDADIYGADTSLLVSTVFNGEKKIGRKEYHYFISVSSETKEITRAAINVLSWFSETLWECKDFKDGTPKHY